MVSSKSLERLVVVEVADMLADERLPIDHQRDRVLEIGAHSENRPVSGQRGNRFRCVAARAPQNDGTEGSRARDGIVDAPRDGALTDEKRIGHAGQAVEGVPIVIGDRLAGAVGAGHHQNFGRARREQQMVQRCVGQHHAELVIVGSDAGQLNLGGSEHDRPRHGREQRLALGIQFDNASRSVEVFDHHGERLLLAVFPLAQRIHGRRIARIAGQVISTQAFHGDDLSLAQQLDRFLHRRFVPADDSASVVQHVMRSTLRARHGLRVKTAVRRIVILPGRSN